MTLTLPLVMLDMKPGRNMSPGELPFRWWCANGRRSVAVGSSLNGSSELSGVGVDVAASRASSETVATSTEPVLACGAMLNFLFEN